MRFFRFVALAALAAPAPALAHTAQLSSTRLTLTGHRVSAVVELNARDLEAELGVRLTGPAGEVEADALARAAPALTNFLLEHARLVNTAGAICRGSTQRPTAKAEHVLVEVQWRCPPMTGTLAYRVTLFHSLDPVARHMVTVTGDVSRLALLSASTPQIALVATRAGLLEVAWHYLLAGIEHIVIGYDHVAFVIAVILWGRKLWPLVGVVTAFTVAHSVTLTLAVLGVVTPPSKLIETLIAISIVYAAAENFFVRDLRRRWMLTFAFGLVHGFGFAGALKEYGIPRDALVPALGAFNLGVELGQMLVVLAALCALFVVERFLAVVARRPPRMPDPALVYFSSGAILALGLYWTVERWVG